MVCEYILFTFPGCGCPALVPLQFCPQHLDPNHADYADSPITLRNPARITMLFCAPAEPLKQTTYKAMCEVYKKPLLAKDLRLSTKAKQKKYEQIALSLMAMQDITVEWHDGAKVNAGFHTKLCRYHVVYPDCKNIQVQRPASDDYWPFAESDCVNHSEYFVATWRKKWSIAARPELEYFEEPFRERFNRACAGRFRDSLRELEALKITPGVDDVSEKKLGEGDEDNAMELEDLTSEEEIEKNEESYEDDDTEIDEDTEGSEYQDSGAEDNEEEEPAAKEVREEIKDDIEGTSRPNEEPKNDAKKKKEAVKTAEPITVKPAAKGLKPIVREKKKKPAPKRKGKRDSDGAWKGSSEGEEDEDIGDVEEKRRPAAKKTDKNPPKRARLVKPRNTKGPQKCEVSATTTGAGDPAGKKDYKTEKLKQKSEKGSGKGRASENGSDNFREDDTGSHGNSNNTDSEVGWKGRASDDSDFEEPATKKKGGNTGPKIVGGKASPKAKKPKAKEPRPSFNKMETNNPDGIPNAGKKKKLPKKTVEVAHPSSSRGDKLPSPPRRRGRRGEGEPEFSGLHRARSYIDEIGSGVRLYRAPGRDKEPLFTQEEMEQYHFPATNQTLDEIFDGWAETQAKLNQ